MISVTILTKNCQETIKKTLESLVRFDEVLILDTGSTDSTLQIVREFPNTTLVESSFLGFGPTHNLASEKARHDWILSIDSDEVVTPALAEEILNLQLDPERVYWVLRHNYFNGKHIKWCAGWHPDKVVRLYHRKKTCFTDDAVHEKVITAGCKQASLRSPLLHTPYREISHFLTKMQIYSSLFAKQHAHKKKASLSRALLHAWATFFKNYILKRGFLGGREGFIISLYNSHVAFYKYLKLEEVQKKSI